MFLATCSFDWPRLIVAFIVGPVCLLVGFCLPTLIRMWRERRAGWWKGTR